MTKDMKTKVGLNRPGSPSLKTTIPQGIVSAMKLNQGDTLEWSIEVKDGKLVVCLEKSE